MTMITTLDDARRLIGQEVGVSDWLVVDQDRINGFADVTDDHQYIHVDPERAAQTPFGGTIAHGFLTLSLLASLASNATPILEGVTTGVNYGFDKIRFVNPVLSGSRIRARFVLADLVEKSGNRFMLIYAVSVEIEGQEKPALTAQWLTMQVIDG